MISGAFKSFWHAMTSNDRHSNYDSPYRTGQHVPLNQENGRINTLTSVATASDSRQDVSSPYADYSSNPMDRILSPTIGGSSPRIPQGQAPYSPGGRSESARRQSQQKGDGFEMQSPTGEIPMQSFQDGMPPAPPVSNSWHRIDNWAEENYPELFDQLCEGCTNNDINELEHILDCSLPNDVRESLQMHDGQERGGNPTGIIFGCMLLDCEEITQEWDNWRRVNSEYLSASAAAAAAAARANAAKVAAAEAAAAAAIAAGNVPGSAGPSSAAGSARSSIDGNAEAASVRSSSSATGVNNGNTMWRQELLARQDCVPAGAVQKAYAHPAWIPLVRDWGGNNLAVDLAPGPRGTWGQVVLFGRDYDTKYVVAKSWSHFLALVADDLSSGKWFIDEDNHELKLREFKSTRVEPPYLDILRWRMDQKYQRRANQNKRKSVVPGTNGSPNGSPYASPVDPTDSRGRQLQRLSLGSPLASPNRMSLQHGNKMSPLARVTEETSLPELNLTLPTHEESETIVKIPSPRPTRAPAAVPPPPKGKSKMSNVIDTLEEAAAATETEAETPTASTASAAASSTTAASSKKATLETADDEDDGAMKTIEI